MLTRLSRTVIALCFLQAISISALAGEAAVTTRSIPVRIEGQKRFVPSGFYISWTEISYPEQSALVSLASASKGSAEQAMLAITNAIVDQDAETFLRWTQLDLEPIFHRKRLNRMPKSQLLKEAKATILDYRKAFGISGTQEPVLQYQILMGGASYFVFKSAQGAFVPFVLRKSKEGYRTTVMFLSYMGHPLYQCATSIMRSIIMQPNEFGAIKEVPTKQKVVVSPVFDIEDNPIIFHFNGRKVNYKAFDPRESQLISLPNIEREENTSTAADGEKPVQSTQSNENETFHVDLKQAEQLLNEAAKAAASAKRLARKGVSDTKTLGDIDAALLTYASAWTRLSNEDYNKFVETMGPKSRERFSRMLADKARQTRYCEAALHYRQVSYVLESPTMLVLVYQFHPGRYRKEGLFFDEFRQTSNGDWQWINVGVERGLEAFLRWPNFNAVFIDQIVNRISRHPAIERVVPER